MRGVVDGSARMSTGTDYYIKGYDLIGKTGTAQIASSKGGYLKGANNYVRSFAGAFPGKDPQVIVYVAASKMKDYKILKSSVKNLVKNVGTYLNVYGKNKNTDSVSFEVNNYLNKNPETVSKEISSAKLIPVVIGDGKKIINQYPSAGAKLNIGNKVFLLTNANEFNMIDITSWSRGDTEVLCKLLNLDVSFDGFGYVKEYSFEKDKPIDFSNILEVKLDTLFKEEEEKKEETKNKK